MLEQKEIIGEVKVIVFRLKDEEYGVDVNQVKSIEKLEHITRVPRTPAFVKGVINLRGVVTPIIDLRNRFSLEETAYTESTRIIIVAVGELEVGLIVDAANDVIDICGERDRTAAGGCRRSGGRLPARSGQAGKTPADPVESG